jgi:hypothetical protein
MRKIKVELSPNGIESAVKQFTAYTAQISAKNRLFVDRLASIGIPIVEAKIRASRGDSEKGTSTYIELLDEGDTTSTARLVVENKDILFIEFGSGIRYNNSKMKNEKAAELGYGVGSYPGQTHAFSKNGWFYEDHGVKIHSYGTEATMPMQSAVDEIVMQIREIAREVFIGE